MSAAAAVEKSNEEDTMMRCASCGTAGGDDIKLKKCTACYLVKYCSVKCQKDHRPKHKRECKKRAAEIRDELLFKQPEGSHHGDCPICCLPLPLDPEKSILMCCCCKSICDGCNIANKGGEIEGRLQPTCAFCRDAVPKTDEQINERLMKRIEANDPAAMCYMGTTRYDEGDYKAAFELWTKAAALDDSFAHYQLSCLYHDGKGVEKDEKREVHHLTEAAIAGHPGARFNLGCVEWGKKRIDRAVKHWIIATKLGLKESLQRIKALYEAGYVSKEDFSAALHGHHAAIDATKSPQREDAAEFMRQVADC